MSRPKDRLDEIMKAYSLPTLLQFSIALGLKTPSSVLAIRREDPEKFNKTMIDRVLIAFPELNPEWLKTGQGKMFSPNKKPRDIHVEMLQKNKGGHNVQNNFALSGSEKIIDPDGRVSIEPIMPHVKSGDAAEMREEFEQLRRECMEWKARYETLRELYQELLSIVKK